ncbi:MAG: restriction endonuclease subunit S, partial [Ignavibacteria bacterium]|nr:restriction endonuclease subunit S [Ignavibacteria bacterium]
DARHGAYGIIPGELDGAVVTGDFPVFKINGINPNYFDFVSKSNHFLEECKRNSQGTTRRVRLDMNKFLSIAIPVPSPEEQKKVVYLVDKINQIKQKKLESIKELDALLPSVIDKAFKGEL